MFKASVIIPTYNRPLELKNCIKSILEQTVKPYELIVVDDGNLSELPVKKECQEKEIHYIYFKKDKPGLTESRNKGIGLASGDIIFFFDDDVVLFPDYISEILSIYQKDKDGIVGGVGGEVVNRKPLKIRTCLRRLFDIFFLVTGFNEGKVLPSGFCVNYGDTEFTIKKIKKVDFLSGGVCSFRKEVFKEFLFNSEKYLGYGLGEDIEFSYRVSKKYTLIFNPKARLLHLDSPKMSIDDMREGRMYMMNRYIFFSEYVKKGWWSWLFFYYALFGYISIRIISLITLPRREKAGELKGYFLAFGDILKGNIRVG